MAIAGQGMALSSDYVIGVAPGISAKAAGRGRQRSGGRGPGVGRCRWITGVIALLLAYFSIRKRHSAGPKRC